MVFLPCLVLQGWCIRYAGVIVMRGVDILCEDPRVVVYRYDMGVSGFF